MLSSEAVLGAPRARAIQAPAAVARVRLDSIDLLRGLVMVVMVLDHARDFIGLGGLNPRDVNDAALFLTRWITHFCAPVFVLLAGVSAYLYGRRGRTPAELSFYLFTRGLWLVLLEMTLVRMGWTFSLRFDFMVFQVIWAIGASMIVLSALVHLPRPAVGAIGLALILGHNLLDGIKAEHLGAWGWIWNFMHQPALLHPVEGLSVRLLYPLVPWAGVMALGFGLGPVMEMHAAERRRWLFIAGSGALALFVALRLSNVYGDPAAWKAQETVLATVLSFLNCEKYPPSLLYLAMTLGPALILLAFADRARGALKDAVMTFGRVPMLFYVAHLFLLHTVAVIIAFVSLGDASWLFGGRPILAKPQGYGFGLPAVYAVWMAVLAALYPLCRWFAALKQRRRDWWLSYL